MNALPIIESCDGCGACCRGRSVPPFTGADDPEFLALPAPLREGLLPLLLADAHADTDESACCWFDRQSLQCRHYEHRPAPCRDFERGSFYCRKYRTKWNV